MMERGTSIGATRLSLVTGSAAILVVSLIGAIPLSELELKVLTVPEQPEGALLEVDGTQLFPGMPAFSDVFRVNLVSVGQQWLPSVVVDEGGTVHVVWADARVPGPWDVFYAQFGCCAPSTNVQVSTGPGAAHTGRDAVAVDANGTVHVVWQSVTAAGSDVNYSFKRAGDAAFAPQIRVNSPGAGEARLPSVAATEDGRAAVTYTLCERHDGTSCDLYMSVGGPELSFGPALKINDDPGPSPQYQSSLAVRGNTLHVAWEDARDGPIDIDMYYARIDLDSGAVTRNVRVNTNRDGHQDNPDLVLDPEGNVLVAWADARTGSDGNDVYAAILPPGSDSFGSEFRVNDVVRSRQFEPAVAILGPKSFLIVWRDFRNGDFDIFGSLVLGGVPRESFEISDAPSRHASFYPDVAAGGGRIAVIWPDEREGISGQPDIYARVGALQGDYSWDLRSDEDSDGDGNATNDVDFTGRLLSTRFGDDGLYQVALTVRDGTEVVFWALIPIQVTNAAPSIDASLQSGSPLIRLTFVLTGEPHHDVHVSIVRGADTVAEGTVRREAGSPWETAVDLGIHSSWSAGELELQAVYLSDDERQARGANPARLIVGDPESPEFVLHHVFNVRHPDSWVWRAQIPEPPTTGPWSLDLRLFDPGSDDLSVFVAWGDGAVDRFVSLHDPSGPDPLRSPEGSPRHVTLTLTHAYLTGDYLLVVTVSDDDGGSSRLSLEVRSP